MFLELSRLHGFSILSMLIMTATATAAANPLQSTPSFSNSGPLFVDDSQFNLQPESSSLNALNLLIQCFTNPATPAPPTLRQIPIIKYFWALQKVLLQELAMIPRQWDLRPSGIIKWEKDDVTIGMNAPWPPSSETLQPVWVARAAALVADQCLRRKTDFLGGQTWIRGNFRVVPMSSVNENASES